MAKKVLLIGPSSPMGVCFPNKYVKHYYIFHVGDPVYFKDVETEFISVLKEADVIYSYLTEEEAEALSKDIKLEIPSRNITRLEEAFFGGYSYDYSGKGYRRLSDPTIYFILPRTEESAEIYKVWLGCTCEG